MTEKAEHTKSHFQNWRDRYHINFFCLFSLCKMWYSLSVFWSISWTIKRNRESTTFSHKSEEEGRAFCSTIYSRQCRIGRFLLRHKRRTKGRTDCRPSPKMLISDHWMSLSRCFSLKKVSEVWLVKKDVYQKNSFTSDKVYKGTKSGEILRYFLVKGMLKYHA